MSAHDLQPGTPHAPPSTTHERRAAAAYARASRDAPDVEAQLRAIRQRSAELGIPVAREYVERKTLDRRSSLPGLERLQREAPAFDIGLVIMTGLDRLGRSPAELLETLQTLGKGGLHIVTSDGRVDTRTAGDGPLFRSAGILLESARRLRSESAKRALDAARSLGRKVGRPPAPFDEERARALRQAGKGWRSTARCVGANWQSVRRRLKGGAGTP